MPAGYAAAGRKRASWHASATPAIAGGFCVQQAVSDRRKTGVWAKKPQVSIVIQRLAAVERNAPMRGRQAKQAAVACWGTQRPAGIGAQRKIARRSTPPMPTRMTNRRVYGSAQRRCVASRNAHCGRSSSRQLAGAVLPIKTCAVIQQALHHWRRAAFNAGERQ